MKFENLPSRRLPSLIGMGKGWYVLIITKVGLRGFSFIPSPFAKPCVKVVFPAPKSPSRLITNAPFLIEVRLLSVLASRSPIFFVSAALFVKIFIAFINLKDRKKEFLRQP